MKRTLPRELDDLSGMRAARWFRESTAGQWDNFGPDAQREQQDRAIERYALVDAGLEWSVASSGWTSAWRTATWETMIGSATSGAFDVLGGPTAVFRTETLAAAARLAEAIAQLPGLEGTRAQLTLVSGRLTVRLTGEVWGVEPEHVDLARAISQVARSLGAEADRSKVQEVQLAIAAKPDAIDLGFRRAMLGYATASAGHTARAGAAGGCPQAPARAGQRWAAG